MDNKEMELIDLWIADPAFISWLKGERGIGSDKWEIYFKTYPDHLELVELAKTSLSIKPKLKQIDPSHSATALANFQRRIESKNLVRQENEKTYNLSFVRKIAAAILLLIGSSVGYQVISNATDLVIIESGGELREVVLEDATKVILNAHSTMSYSKKEARNITLNGEAYFDVTSMPEKVPFTVFTKDLKVLVTGTEFNVNCGLGKTSVYLDEGKVYLTLANKTKEEIEMEPGDLISFSNKQNKILEQRKAVPLETTSWKEQIILFDNASIQQVVNSINLVYKVDIVYDVALDDHHGFTGGIPVNNLYIALQTLRDVYQLDIEESGEQYLIKKKQ